jgi:hypothetical protein
MPLPIARSESAVGLARRTWKGLAHLKACVWSSVVADNLVRFTRLKPG